MIIAVVLIITYLLVAPSSPYKLDSGPPPLTVTANVSPSSGVAYLAVEYSAMASGGSGSYTSYTWNLGDGVTATGSSGSYTYQVPGTYMVSVTVVDSSGATSASASVPVTVSPAQITITGFTFAPDYTGTTTGYFDSSYTCDSGCPFTVTGGTTFSLTITLTSSALIFDHEVDDFDVSSPFTLATVSPTLPVELAPGDSATFTVSVTAPSDSGSYSISGTIVTN